MTSFIRGLPASAEFGIVMVVCFWSMILGSIQALATHSWAISSRVSLTNRSALPHALLDLYAFLTPAPDQPQLQ